jgi:hypothetical protein
VSSDPACSARRCSPSVGDRATDLGGDRLGAGVGGDVVDVHTAPSPVALQPMGDMEHLLEEVLQQQADERRRVAANSIQIVRPPPRSIHPSREHPVFELLILDLPNSRR